MKKISGEDILKALQKDSRFTSMTKETFDILIPFILNASEALGKDLLSSRVEVSTLLQAKIIFIEYCLSHGFAEKTAGLLASTFKTAQESAVGLAKKIREIELPSSKVLSGQVRTAMDTLVKFYRVSLEQLPLIMKAAKEPELSLLIGFGMSKETAMRCLKEDLTIAELLLIEPGSILINKDSNKK